MIDHGLCDLESARTISVHEKLKTQARETKRRKLGWNYWIYVENFIKKCLYDALHIDKLYNRSILFLFLFFTLLNNLLNNNEKLMDIFKLHMYICHCMIICTLFVVDFRVIPAQFGGTN